MRIGLFPLNLVLFPESIYPLHIFEERFKLLVNECISRNEKFGIVFSSGIELASYGCTAKVHQIIKKYPDGKIDISVKGYDRFKLIALEEDNTSYSKADIEIVDDITETIDEELLDDCIDLFNFITNKIPVFRVQKTTKDELIGVRASYYFAQKVGLIGKQKQHLLELNSENLRLDYLRNHLLNIKPSVSKAIEIEKIIRNDGYLPR